MVKAADAIPGFPPWDHNTSPAAGGSTVDYLLPTDSINAIVAQQLADIEMN